MGKMGRGSRVGGWQTYGLEKLSDERVWEGELSIVHVRLDALKQLHGSHRVVLLPALHSLGPTNDASAGPTLGLVRARMSSVAEALRAEAFDCNKRRGQVLRCVAKHTELSSADVFALEKPSDERGETGEGAG